MSLVGWVFLPNVFCCFSCFSVLICAQGIQRHQRLGDLDFVSKGLSQPGVFTLLLMSRGFHCAELFLDCGMFQGRSVNRPGFCSVLF